MKNKIVLAFVVLPLWLSAQTNWDSVRIEPVRISDHLYMLKGSGGNIGVLAGKDGILMVDDQFAPLSPKIRDAIRTLDPGEIRFLVNTHIHGDHSGGNENFKKMGVTIVAHDNVRNRMMKEHLYKNEKEPPRSPDAWPIITVSDKISLHLNDEDIEVFHLASGHTDGDLIIYFRNANVFHTGDMFVRYGYPYIDPSRGGSINAFIGYLDKLLPIMNDQSKVIPGHGELATKADVKVFRDALVDIRDQVSAALKQGKKLQDLAALPIAHKYDRDWGKSFISGKDFVMFVGESLTGM